MIAVREEDISFLPAAAAPEKGLCATVTEKSFSAGLLRISARLDNSNGDEIKSSVQGFNSSLKPGDKVTVNWKPSGVALLERE
jgi:ABC-type Fe3+/spermidine/putrescine transport system ATPase subunit